MSDQQQTRADFVAICVHEAGHAVVAAALGLPLATATATPACGAVELGEPPRPAAAPVDARFVEALASLGGIALAAAGGLAVCDRLDRRPAARWRRAGPEAEICAPSWSDRKLSRACETSLRRLGLWPALGVVAARRVATLTLARNARVTARVAAALYRQGRLERDALAALLAPVAVNAMSAIAAEAELFKNPTAPPPADATGATRGQETNMKKIFEKLRPKGQTVLEIGEALDRTGEALAEAQGTLADLQGRRGAALLAGGAEAERHEAALREARDDAERLAALTDALSQRHAEAERQERRARLEAQAAEAARAAEAAGRAIAREYPKLAGHIVALLRAEREALASIDALTAELSAAPAEATEGIALPAAPITFYGARAEGPVAMVARPLSATLRLPRHDDPDLGMAGQRTLWPDG